MTAIAPTLDALSALWARWDSVVTKLMLGAFSAVGWEKIHTPSPATVDLPFVKTPTALITAIITYLAIILGTFLSRALSGNKQKTNNVKKEDPAWLRLFMLLHNIFLVSLSTFMFVGTVYQARKYGYSFWGNMMKPEEVDLARMLYIFYLSKIYEFNDTFIMLMKGNIHQVSFLHVYHHVSISIVWWFLVYSYPGGDTYYTCALNSFVHILMYTYYLLALILGKDMKKRQKYLWWGKYMTLLQMAQFVSMSFQAVYCYYLPGFPKFLSKVLFLYMQTLLVLFANFYVHKHVFKAKKKVA